MPHRTVLIVDDNPEHLTGLGELLRERYRVRVANSGARVALLAESAPWHDIGKAEQRGRHFDPDVLAAFFDGCDTFCGIARSHPAAGGLDAPSHAEAPWT